jgi:hypothetical protein
MDVTDEDSRQSVASNASVNTRKRKIEKNASDKKEKPVLVLFTKSNQVSLLMYADKHISIEDQVVNKIVSVMWNSKNNYEARILAFGK